MGETVAFTAILMILKWVAYSQWCGRGAYRFGKPQGNPHPYLMGLYRLLIGAAVLAIGLGAGWLWFTIMGDGDEAMKGPVFYYLGPLQSLRWFAWAGTERLFAGPPTSFTGWLLGDTWPQRNWRLGGMGLSMLFDACCVAPIAFFNSGAGMCCAAS